MTSLVSADPSLRTTRIETRRADGAAPGYAVDELAAIPATSVPCPYGSPCPPLFPGDVRSMFVVSLPAKACPLATPESTIAIAGAEAVAGRPEMPTDAGQT
jgi:hypothetical protein